MVPTEFVTLACWTQLCSPQRIARNESADVIACAATYAFHLTRNHPFVDGNKRIGLATCEVFLNFNGLKLTANNDQLVELFLQVAAGEIERDDIDRQLRTWVVADSSGE